MDSTELAANLFRITQTEEKLRSNNIVGKERACDAHYEVGAKVRQTMGWPSALPKDGTTTRYPRRRLRPAGRGRSEHHPRTHRKLHSLIRAWNGITDEAV